jgi:hypothetical protein
MGRKSSAGQIELILLVPLLLSVVFLNLTIMQSMDSNYNNITALRLEYESLIQSSNYNVDPATGNFYPVGG